MPMTAIGIIVSAGLVTPGLLSPVIVVEGQDFMCIKRALKSGKSSNETFMTTKNDGDGRARPYLPMRRDGSFSELSRAEPRGKSIQTLSLEDCFCRNICSSEVSVRLRNSGKPSVIPFWMVQWNCCCAVLYLCENSDCVYMAASKRPPLAKILDQLANTRCNLYVSWYLVSHLVLYHNACTLFCHVPKSTRM